MTEAPSKTSNHQRLEEMMTHLTPKGAVIPYSLCYDSAGFLWVASKGGLFKFDAAGKELLFERKNVFPRKMEAFCQVASAQDKIIHIQSEGGLTEFRILSLDGEVEHEQFLDGKIQSLAVSPAGDIYVTKQPGKTDSEFLIYKTSMDSPLGWDELISEDDFCFQSICLLDPHTLAAATCSVPNNMYSKQGISLIDTTTGEIKVRFSGAGKEAGQVYFPRSMQAYKDGLLVLDKTGRIQHFDRAGKLLTEAARIDAYLGNGFVVKDDEAVITCSGIVLTQEGESICDDWVEAIKLDGSFWTAL